MNDFGTGKNSPLEFLSNRKEGTGTQVHRLLDEYSFSRTREVGSDSEEIKIRTFFRDEQDIIDYFTFFACHIEPENIREFVMVYISLSQEIHANFRETNDSPYHTLKTLRYIIEKENLNPENASGVISFYMNFEDSSISDDVNNIISES